MSRSERELRADFRLADRNCDGRINYEEFKELLDGLDADMTEEEMKVGFHEVDTDHDGLIDVTEFVEWWNG